MGMYFKVGMRVCILRWVCRYVLKVGMWVCTLRWVCRYVLVL